MKACLLLSTALLLTGSLAHAAGDEALARNLITSLGCKGCHSFEGSGGAFGPPLDTIGRQLDAAQIADKLRNPDRSSPDSMMPSYAQLNRDELDALAGFLAARR